MRRGWPLFLLFSLSTALSSKRGLIYISTTHEEDYSLFISQNASLSWYYNYSPYPSLSNSDLPFIPMIHGTSDTSADVSTIKSLSGITHILTFNEPDGTTESGGSNISPHAAAKAYVEEILPLREPPHNLRISLPATTGSGVGIEWLSAFNESCYRLNPRRGCPADFLAAHWYGDLTGLASWLGTLHDLYPALPIWLTEYAIPQADELVTAQFLNESLAYLDGLDYVQRYAWFAPFRRDSATEWTGPNVAMLGNGGGLTELGAQYLGGARNGFHAGEKGGVERIKLETGICGVVLVLCMLHVLL